MLSLTGDKMNDTAEIRYQEDGKLWNTLTYTDGATLRREGWLGTQPKWLQLILDVAKVGGHYRKLGSGPPDVVLWFTIDSDNNLLEITFP